MNPDASARARAAQRPRSNLLPAPIRLVAAAPVQRLGAHASSSSSALPAVGIGDDAGAAHVSQMARQLRLQRLERLLALEEDTTGAEQSAYAEQVHRLQGQGRASSPVGSAQQEEPRTHSDVARKCAELQSQVAKLAARLEISEARASAAEAENSRHAASDAQRAAVAQRDTVAARSRIHELEAALAAAAASAERDAEAHAAEAQALRDEARRAAEAHAAEGRALQRVAEAHAAETRALRDQAVHVAEVHAAETRTLREQAEQAKAALSAQTAEVSRLGVALEEEQRTAAAAQEEVRTQVERARRVVTRAQTNALFNEDNYAHAAPPAQDPAGGTEPFDEAELDDPDSPHSPLRATKRLRALANAARHAAALRTARSAPPRGAAVL
jgi:hypothetical protein